jgi:uncharacterized protein YabN with tetrapyrrole methylase and pyrophosphatase domain
MSEGKRDDIMIWDLADEIVDRALEACIGDTDKSISLQSVTKLAAKSIRQHPRQFEIITFLAQKALDAMVFRASEERDIDYHD